LQPEHRAWPLCVADTGTATGLNTTWNFGRERRHTALLSERPGNQQRSGPDCRVPRGLLRHGERQTEVGINQAVRPDRRFAYEANEYVTPYAGAAYEHELNRKDKATVCSPVWNAAVPTGMRLWGKAAEESLVQKNLLILFTECTIF